MRYENVAVVLTPKQIIQLDMIIHDEDSQGAYEFLKSVVWPQIQNYRKSHCEPQIGWTNPPDYTSKTRGD